MFRSHRLLVALSLLLTACGAGVGPRGQTPVARLPDGPAVVAAEYRDGSAEVELPLGPLAFADEAVAYHEGERPPGEAFRDAERALGEPDYTSPSSPEFVSLGCDGAVVLQFRDNVIVDQEGPDLYVFEVGPAVEATELAVSADGTDWVELGRIEGSTTTVDLAGRVGADDVFTYVRLTNAGSSCGGATAGADIDAVASLGTALRLSLDAVHFEVDEATLDEAGQAAVDALAARLRGAGRIVRLFVDGHTDATGSDARNQALSRERAETVATRLQAGLDEPPETVLRRGFGAAQPVADSATEEGRAQNRRVDVVAILARR